MKALGWQQSELIVAAASESAKPIKLQARRLPGAWGAAVIAPPHPLYGGTFDNPVVIGIADGLQRAGAGALAFNWRGIDGSEGAKTDSLEAAVEDYRAALATLRALEPEAPLYAAGYSFGAGAALLAAREEPALQGLILLAPPLGLLRVEDLAATSVPILVVVGDDDEYAPLKELEPILATRAGLSLVVIPGADHFFHYGGHTELAVAVAEHVQRWRS